MGQRGPLRADADRFQPSTLRDINITNRITPKAAENVRYTESKKKNYGVFFPPSVATEGQAAP